MRKTREDADARETMMCCLGNVPSQWWWFLMLVTRTGANFSSSVSSRLRLSGDAFFIHGSQILFFSFRFCSFKYDNR